MKSVNRLLIACLVFGLAQLQALEGWRASTTYIIGTTEDWATIPAGTSVTDFPLLVRLESPQFDFNEAEPNGEDIRFTKENGTSLPYEIETWDSQNGFAAIWVKMDVINGDELQVINMHWGNSGAVSESDGEAVFNLTDNSYAGVYHFSSTSPFADASDKGNNGTNNGTSEVSSLIGNGRYFDHTTIELDTSVTDVLGVGEGSMSFWIKTDTTINGGQAWNGNCLLGSDSELLADTWWGILHNGRVGMTPSQGSAPLSVTRIDDDSWHHVTLTRNGVTGKVETFVEGVLENTDTLSTGDMYNNVLQTLGRSIHGYVDSGYIIASFDEIRIVDKVLSPEWVKLSYENQRSLPTLISRPQVPGCVTNFGVEAGSVSLNEGESTTITGTADCALIAKWSRVDGSDLIPLATDGLTANIKAGRVNGNTQVTYRFSALYGTVSSATWTTSDVVVTITENIPDPVFTISGDEVYTTAIASSWNGLAPLVMYPEISNLSAIQNSDAPTINRAWTGSGVIAIVNGNQNLYSPVLDDTISLTGPGSDGALTISLCMDNGGTQLCDTTTINIAIAQAFEFTNALTDTVISGVEYTITWNTVAPNVEFVDIFYYAGWSPTQIADSIPNTGSFSFTLPSTVNLTNNTIRFRVTDVASGLTSELSDVPAVVPVETALIQRNLSFNARGIVNPLSIKQGQFQRVDIIDIKGGIVQSLPVLSTSVYWDGKNNAGNQAEPGLYIVRFNGKKYNQQYKIVLRN